MFLTRPDSRPLPSPSASLRPANNFSMGIRSLMLAAAALLLLLTPVALAALLVPGPLAAALLPGCRLKLNHELFFFIPA